MKSILVVLFYVFSSNAFATTGLSTFNWGVELSIPNHKPNPLRINESASIEMNCGANGCQETLGKHLPLKLTSYQSWVSVTSTLLFHDYYKVCSIDGMVPIYILQIQFQIFQNGRSVLDSNTLTYRLCEGGQVPKIVIHGKSEDGEDLSMSFVLTDLHMETKL